MAAPSIIGPHKCFGNILEVKFAQVRYFLSQNIGATKDIVSPLVPTFGAYVTPSHMKLGT